MPVSSTPATSTQLVAPAANGGPSSISRTLSGSRPSGALPAHSKDKPPGKQLSAAADGIARGGAADVAGCAGSHKPGRLKPDKVQPEKVPEQVQAYDKRPVSSATAAAAGKKTVPDSTVPSLRKVVSTEGLRTVSGAAPKIDAQHKLKAGKATVATARPKALAQTLSPPGSVLAERRAMLQWGAQKTGANGISGDRHHGSGARDSATDEREARIKAEKAAMLLKSAKKREQAALKQQVLAERAATQQAHDAAQRKENKRRRHAEREEEGGHSGSHKVPRNGVKAHAGGLTHEVGKLLRQPPVSAREDSLSKHGSQRIGGRSSKDGAGRGEADLSDEDGKKAHSSHWEHEAGVPGAKLKRVAFAHRVTQLDSSSEDDYATEAPERCPVSMPHAPRPTSAPAHASAEQGSRRKADASQASGAGARDTAKGSEKMHARRDTKANDAAVSVNNLEGWGAEVEKLMADRRAYLGEGASMHTTKAQGSKREVDESPPIVAAAVSVHAPNHSSVRGPRPNNVGASARVVRAPAQAPVVQRDVAMHEVETQTEDADVRSSAAQTPSVWGRSTQCQTDARGVHEQLRVGAPVTVDTGCQASGDLQKVPEASDKVSSMREDATEATNALEVIERMLTHATHAQRKQLRSQCRSLGQLIAEVSGAAAPRAHAAHAPVSAEPAQGGNDDQNAAMHAQPSPRSLDEQTPGVRQGIRDRSPDWNTAMHDTHANQSAHESDEQDRHTLSVGASRGHDEWPLALQNSPPREESGDEDAEADMHGMHERESAEDSPSLEEDGLRGFVQSEGDGEGQMDEDLEADFDAVFGAEELENDTPTTCDGLTPGTAKSSVHDVHADHTVRHAGYVAVEGEHDEDTPMHADGEWGEPEAEPPVATVAAPRVQPSYNPTSSQPHATASYSAAARVGRSYSSAIAHGEVSDDEMLLEVSPGAQGGALGSGDSHRGVSEDLNMHAPSNSVDNEMLRRSESSEELKERQRGESGLQSDSPSREHKQSEARFRREKDQRRQEEEAQRAHADNDRIKVEKQTLLRRLEEQRRRLEGEDSGGRDTVQTKSRRGSDGGSDHEQGGLQEHKVRRSDVQEPLDVALKAQILGKLSKMLPKANLEVATAKRIIKKLELDLRVNLKRHSDFVKHWIDKYLSDAAALTAAAAAAANEAASRADASVGASGGADGANNSMGVKAASGRAIASDGGGRKWLASSVSGAKDSGNGGFPGSRPGTPSSSGAGPLSVAQRGRDSPAVSTGMLLPCLLFWHIMIPCGTSETEV